MKNKMCPRCKKLTLDSDKIMNCLSRRDGKIHICTRCGDEEAMIDLGSIPSTKKEKEFIKTHIRKHKHP